MSNRGELLDLMRSLANVDENRLPDDEGTTFLNDAMDDIAGTTSLRMFEAFFSSAISAGVSTFTPTPPTGHLVQIDDIFYVVATSGKKQTIHQKSWREYLEAWGTASTDAQGTGNPCEFAIYGESDDGDPVLYLGPIPQDDITPVFVSGRIRFDHLVEDDDDNKLTSRYPLMVAYKALVLAADFLEDPDRATNWQGSYDRILKRENIQHSEARRAAKVVRSMREPG